MILTCNSCGKKFVVPDSAITASGRTVQCGSCGNKWKQYPKNEEKISSVKIKEAPSVELSTVLDFKIGINLVSGPRPVELAGTIAYIDVTPVVDVEPLNLYPI